VLIAFEISEALRNLNFINKQTYIISTENTVVPPSVLTHRTLKIDGNKCIGCGNCVAHCIPNQVWKESNTSHIYTLMGGPTRLIVNGYSRVLEYCTGCIQCIIDKVCPFGAIQAYNEWEYPDLAIIKKDLQNASNNVIIIDAEKLAEEVGNILTANVVLLGVLTGTEVIPISKKVLGDTIKQFAPKKAMEVNIKAFEMGYEIGIKYKK
jgi:ferredoxin